MMIDDIRFMRIMEYASELGLIILTHAGIDIGLTMIGMHLKSVAVPVRLSINKIGNAPIVCARTRPKFIGGARANYDENML